MSKHIRQEDDFGQRVTFDLGQRSYDNGSKEFQLYVTGTTGCHIHMREGNDYISSFLSADDLIFLRDWIEDNTEPATAKMKLTRQGAT